MPVSSGEETGITRLEQLQTGFALHFPP